MPSVDDVAAILPRISIDMATYVHSFLTDTSTSRTDVDAMVEFVGPVLESEDVHMDEVELDQACRALLATLELENHARKDALVDLDEPRRIAPVSTATPSARPSKSPDARSRAKSPPSKSRAAKSAGKTSSKGTSSPTTEKAAPPALEKEGSASGLDGQDADIVVTTQVSRFWLDSFDPDSTEIDLPGVQVIVDGRELLKSSRLRLKQGVRYALCGRNGVGKTTLMRAIGNGTMIGFPRNIRVLYLEQEASLANTDQNVVASVVASDKERARIMHESKLLEAAIKEGGDATSKAYREIVAEHAEAERLIAWQNAEKRSGARGWDARKVLLIKEAAANAAKRTAKEGVDDIAADIEAAHEMLNKLYEDQAEINAEEAKHRAVKILEGLGFDEEKRNSTISELSGGWRMRLALAQALFLNPDLLLLDEPTNHLDLPSTLWLQEYLKTTTSTILLVSHDVNFLNSVCNEIIHFFEQTLTYFPGTYDEFIKFRDEKRQMKQHQQEVYDKKKKHMEKSIENALKAARAHNDDKKLAQAASRKKAIEKLGPTHYDSGKRFKQSYHAGYHLTEGLGIEQVAEDEEVTMKIPSPESKIRNNTDLIQVDGLWFRYSADDDWVLKNVEMGLPQGCRVGVIGANGSGKSTLLQLILGILTPTKGHVNRNPAIRIGYFAQHQVESLPTGTISPLTFMKQRHPDLSEGDLRGCMSGVGLPSFAHTSQTISSLSGGQKSRLALADVLASKPHLLVLDEITNHLDLWTIQGLAEALKETAKDVGILIVSHDVRFVREVCEQVWVVSNCAVRRLDEGLDEYVKTLQKAVKKGRKV
ncbi:P-loop containing nucleoside triphosphate hydrolase protein [Cladochytrium replicatum]|nr:P-loop containing nucleoside triphosphate hydrolase protein [Cladochytrium replicatum]